MDTPIKRLIDIYGSVSRTAIALQVDRQLVDIWQKQGFIPFKRGVEIEKKTDGQIMAVDVWEAAARGRVDD